MTRLQVLFPHISEALNFLACTMEPHPPTRWKELSGLNLRIQTTPPITLEGPMEWLQAPHVHSLLDYHGATPAPATDSRKTGWSLVMDLYRNVELLQASPHKACKSFLVVPASDDPQAHYDLLDVLGGLRGFEASVLRVSSPDLGNRRIFQLQSESEGGEPPHSLPGAPAILADYSGCNLFTPAGRAHPFCRGWARLLPPSLSKEPMLWMPSNGSSHIVTSLSSQSPPQPVLSILDLDFTAQARPATPVALSEVDIIPLEVVPGPPRPIDDRSPIAACIYRLRTRRSQVGSELLRLMDLDEAGVYNLTYFNRATTSSPFSDVEHFLLQEGIEIAQEDEFPHLERFDAPLSLRDAGLAVFFSQRCRVRPDISQLVDHLSPDEHLLLRLRKSLHLDDLPDAVVLVEAGVDPRKPVITLLSGGRPLHEIVARLLRSWDGVPAERALTLQFPDFEERQALVTQQWLSCGKADSAEINRRTGEFTAWVRAEVDSIVARMSQSADRLSQCAHIAAEGAALVTNPPTDIQRLLADTAALVSSLAEPRRVWLASVEQRDRDHRLLADAADQLGVDAHSKAISTRQASEGLVAVLQGRQRDMTTALGQLTRTQGELEKRRADVERETHAARQCIEEGRAAYQRKREELLGRLSEAQSARAALDAQVAEVRALEARVSELESDNSRLAAQTRSRRLSAEARRTTAVNEGARLEHVRDVEIPTALEAIERLETEVASLGSKGFDSELLRLSGMVATSEAKRSALRATEARCAETSNHLRRVNADIDALRALELDSKLTDIDRHIRAAQETRQHLEGKADELNSQRRVLSEAADWNAKEGARLSAAEAALRRDETPIADEHRRLDQQKAYLAQARARLERLRDVELPAASHLRDELAEEVESLQARGLDFERLSEATRALSSTRDRLLKLEAALAPLAENENLKRQIDALEAKAIDFKRDKEAATRRRLMAVLDATRNKLRALSPSSADAELAFDEAQRRLEEVRRTLGISWWRVVLSIRRRP